MNFRLYRSRDRVVAGVAGGVAEALDLDPSLVRIVWALAMFAGFPILVYIVMAIVVPEEPGDWEPWRPTTQGTPARTTPAGVIPATPDVPGSTPYATPDLSSTADTTSTYATDPSATMPADAPAVAPAPGHDGWREARWADRQARREERWAERQERRANRRDGTGAIVFGLILILVGAGFLAHQLVPNLDWDQIWPVGLVAIGVLLLVGSLTRRPAA